MDKERFLKWLKHMKGGMEIAELVGEESAYRFMIQKVESGFFDKEVTPCKNATPATTE